MEVIIDFKDGSHTTWLFQTHNAIDKLIAALKENLAAEWSEITIKILNTGN